MNPLDKAVAVTPSDATDLTGAKQLYVGGAGNLTVRLASNPTVTITFAGVAAGTWLDMYVTRVMAATTATNIVAIY